MYTQCPHCRAVFRVWTAQLSAAQGLVRCSQCNGFFNALQTLQEDPSGAAPAVLASASLPEPASEPELTQALVPPLVPNAEDRLASLPAPFPPTETARTYSAAETLAWSFGILILLAALVLQAAYHERDALSAHGQLRPWIERLCRYLDCELPPRRELTAIRIIDREVRQHPHEPDALLINLTLTNTAPFSQPYPDLELSLTEINDPVVGRRRFQPAEYLYPGVDIALSMPPNVPLQIVLELVEPKGKVAGFRFKFL